MAEQPTQYPAFKVTEIIYITLMCELIEERYGAQFAEMCAAVQNEIIMLVGGGELGFMMQCVRKKFDDPTFSIKKALIEEMGSQKTAS